MTLTPEIRGKQVRRNKAYEDVINLLWIGSKSGNKQEKVFNDIKDIIVFAAMVGKKFEKREAVSKDNQGILLDTFAGGGSMRDSRVDQHNILFMFAMLNHQDMDYMRDEKIDEVIDEFEQYSNGGLNLMQSWIAQSAYDPLCLLEKMIDQISKSSSDTGMIVEDNPFA